jgi:hypothetical protein
MTLNCKICQRGAVVSHWLATCHHIFYRCLQSEPFCPEMIPPSDKVAVGSLWYKTILQDAYYPSENASNNCTLKPDGWDTGSDSLNWMVVCISSGHFQYLIICWRFSKTIIRTSSADSEIFEVLPSDPQGMQIRTISNGAILETVTGKAGLNYGASSDVRAWPQRMELLDSSGNVLLASSGGRCISSYVNFSTD